MLLLASHCLSMPGKSEGFFLVLMLSYITFNLLLIMSLFDSSLTPFVLEHSTIRRLLQ